MTDTPRRSRGRPRLDPDDDTVQVHVGLPAKQYDSLCDLANRHRLSVPEVVRRVVRVLTTKADSDSPDK
jgi:hypothetical protein